MPADLAVIGLGPLGLPLAQAAVSAGIPTLGYHTGEEPGALSPAELRRMLAGGFRPATDPAALGRVRTVVICAPTPPAADGGLDLSQLETAARALAGHLRPHTTVILESPVLPGTTETFLRPLLEQGSGLVAGRDFHLAHSPSRVDPGSRAFTPANTPKVIGGLTPACTESAAAFYGRLTDKVVRARGLREAETVQLLETNYRHVNIALVNEMAVLCHELGVDLWDVVRCAETKPFGFQAFRPGPGVGGHGVPQDLSGLTGRGLRMVELARKVNSRMPRYVVQRAAALLNEHGKSARGARVLLLGVTYKPDLADLQGTPAEEIAERLTGLGASVSYHDPYVPTWSIGDRPVPRADALYEAVAEADLTILLQHHRTYDLQGLSVKAQLLLDTRGAAPQGAAHRL
ncbi:MULTISPECIES: nucleotide sugar dehydrogenase [Streptomyces]|uniref:Nucleotide sugar dehydrogenase n=1 Tax=Streptomyces thermoviolaceus subsp. thermoviolaceus TaxID=66860 RepID=A0ABX0YPW7_STRTL|nr:MULTISPECIES: nucleotide sugar dehydrogenase [Streptomyces]MCM3263700.1 nucleotide sugar dehydrogenase [Streptomyces thermoviolaceus]NJP14621.1 nucleotide sugar dehydrogenase [Streptomyces thermoviolaceus subsp. thermoviolaceus]RSS07937.1 nucleotide sugar dehydrogenase [Streptomyces sp. WAC00469]WTD47833.1 nucleotide sugar dehydrogenase [Streptomyces thermoviolaceus]GGV74710.1 UDP-N-acetyl-D-glucosamine dehydrogenase [Streptomyces thermoviolaceus subsp. apingens]